MSKLTDIHKVICHSGHKLACFIIVIEAVRKRLKLSEHITSHLSLHSDTHNMSVILNKKVETHSQKIKSKQRKTESHNQRIFLIGNKIIEHISENNRVTDTYKRHKK